MFINRPYSLSTEEGLTAAIPFQYCKCTQPSPSFSVYTFSTVWVLYNVTGVFQMIFQIKIRDGMLYLMGRQMKVGQLMVEETRVGKLILMYNATIASNGVMYQEIVLTPGLMFPIFLNVEIANKVGIPQRNVMHQEDWDVEIWTGWFKIMIKVLNWCYWR